MTKIRLILSSLLAVGVLALSASPALAFGTHVFSASFGSEGSGSGQFEAPAGVAVNESTHDVYVADEGNNRVEYFNAEGDFEGEFNGARLAAIGTITLEPTEKKLGSGIKVVSTDIGAFQLGDEIEAEGLPAGTKISGVLGDGFFEISRDVELGKYGSSVEATAHRALDGPEAIAVDNSCFLHKTPAEEVACKASDPSAGDVYVTDKGSKVVEKFGPTGAYLGEITTGEPVEIHEEINDGGYDISELRVLGVAVGINGVVSVYQGTFTSHTLGGGAPGAFDELPGEVNSYSDGEPNSLMANRKTQNLTSEIEEQAQRGFAVGPVGDLYVAYAAPKKGKDAGSIAKLNSEGKVIVENFGEPHYFTGGETEAFGGQEDTTMIAVEISNDDIYLDNWDASKIERRSPSGLLIESFGSKQLGQNRHDDSEPDSRGVAVSSVGGDVYVTNMLDDMIEIYTPVPGPGIGGEQVTNVAGTAATLRAEINPNEADTTYHFEYDTSPYTSDASHGTSLPGLNADIGSGGVPVPVSVRLESLQPGASYYYRVVAESKVEVSAGVFAEREFYGPDQVLTTPALPTSPPESCPNGGARAEQPYGLTLPDCRAYEMVSPLEKNDTDAVTATHDAARSSLSGGAFTYQSLGIFAGPEAGWGANQYVARRGPDGWSDVDIAPALAHEAVGAHGPYDGMAFAPELTEGIALSDSSLTSEAHSEDENLYLADFASTPISYQLVAPTGIAPGAGAIPEVQGVSTDLSHVVYQTMPNGEGAAEWVEGNTFALAGAGGGGGQPGENAVSFSDDSWRSVSADGSRVFFTTTPTTQVLPEATGRQLFVEENATSPVKDCAEAEDKCVLELSKSQRKVRDPLGPGAARFRGASVNGSRVFFTDCSKLTEEATAVAEARETTCYPAAGTGNDLYEYDFEKPEGERLTDLTVDGTDPLGAQVVGVPYISESGEYVYFVAEGKLAGSNAEGGEPVSGEANLYVAHLEGGSWATSFIATLASSTSTSEGIQRGGDSAVWNQMAPLDSARATPDGARLVFVSHRSLTGYDNGQAETGECENNEEPKYSGAEGGACGEVFSYDAVSQKLVCVSCDPSGVRPVSPASLEEPLGEGGASEAIGYTRRNVSENGARVFFDSSDALVTHDSSGRQNVYEWERAGGTDSSGEAEKGENSCTSSSSSFDKMSGGCIFAISDAAGDYESFFLDADPTGGNVFFATEDRLVPADTDNHVDVYDARVGGGFPVAASAPECDNADSCKPPASPQPALFAAPSSATFSGPGNPVAPPPALVKPKPTKKTVKCKKPKKLTHGKCLKPKRRAKKSSKSKRGGKS